MKPLAKLGTLAASVSALFLAFPTFADDSRFVDRSTLVQVQRTLQDRGFRPGGADGKMGPATQQAIRSFQKSESLEPTGQLNRQTLVALGLQRDAVAMDDAGYSAATIRAVQQTLNNRGFRAGPANGMLGESTRTALREFQKSENLEDNGRINPRTLAALGVAEPPTTVARAEPPARPMHLRYASQTVRDVQRQLRLRGYYAGPIDGMAGPATRTALRNFQHAKNLEARGQIDGATLAALELPEPLARLDR